MSMTTRRSRSRCRRERPGARSCVVRRGGPRARCRLPARGRGAPLPLGGATKLLCPPAVAVRHADSWRTALNIDARIEQVEEAVGKRLIVRSIRTPEPEFRGWVEVRPSAVVIEYVEELPGYFWGFGLLERLLEWVESDGGSAWFYEQDRRLVRISATRDETQGGRLTQ